jgi:hypothetical protein
MVLPTPVGRGEKAAAYSNRAAKRTLSEPLIRVSVR